ncbi:MAG: hypothetical protein WCJ95_19340 [Mariniphaga sp.]
MKRTFRYHTTFFVFLSILVLLLTGNAESQSLIYGIANGRLVTFDYRSGAYDTVPVTTNFPNPNTSFGCAIDPYNGRYFFDAVPTSQGGTVKYIDLYALTSASTCYFEYKNWIEYNCLNNSLIFETPDGDFYSYNLGNSVLTHLSILPPSTGIIYGETRLYNPVNNTLFFQRYNDSTHYDIIDGFTGELIHTHVAHRGYIESAVVDYQTGKYYGVRHDTIIQFDPFTDESTPVIALPMHLVHLNSQMAVYDQDSAKYIIPSFKNATNKAYYIVADVKKPCIDKVFEQPDQNVNWQRIFCKPQTMLTRIGDSLFCPKGVSYQWQLNNNTIPNAASSSYKPTQSGLYQAVVEYQDYTSESKVFDFAMTDLSDMNSSAGIHLYPNPAGDVISYDISGISNCRNDVWQLEILNNLGKPVLSAIDRAGHNMQPSIRWATSRSRMSRSCPRSSSLLHKVTT